MTDAQKIQAIMDFLGLEMGDCDNHCLRTERPGSHLTNGVWYPCVECNGTTKKIRHPNGWEWSAQ